MKKENLILLGIALLFISTNWTRIKQWDRSNGLTESSIQPVSLGIIFAMVAAWALANAAYAMIRHLSARA